jgi:hypothetical protein
MRDFCFRINVVKIESFFTSTPSALFTVKKFGAALGNPQSAIFSLKFFRFHWHGSIPY